MDVAEEVRIIEFEKCPVRSFAALWHHQQLHGLFAADPGCSQLIRAVQIVLEKPDDIQTVHKQIYAVIAKEYDLQPRSVESNIRTLSDIAWKNDPTRLVQIAGYPLDNRSSAVQFIEIFSNYIQRNYLEERILT